jgi:hypothetical protein
MQCNECEKCFTTSFGLSVPKRFQDLISFKHLSLFHKLISQTYVNWNYVN